MLFSEVIGQEKLAKQLAETVISNRLSHAWLLFGPEGSGKLPLAIAFAQYISCLDRQGTDACGKCSSCVKYKKLIHPDLHFTFPVNKTRSVTRDNLVSDDFIASWRTFVQEQPYGGLTQWYDIIEIENRQGIINTEESKLIASRLGFKAYESDYKISIIWQADKMNDQAANKLLKLIEEPPPFTVFILISENPDHILPTIRSRCVNLKVPRMDDQSICRALTENLGLDEEKALRIARISSGNYLKALNLANESGEGNFNFVRFRDLMRACYSKNLPGIVKTSEELAGLTREKQKSFLEYGLATLRECMAIHFDHPELVYVSDDESEFAYNFAPFITERNIMGFSEEFTRAQHDIERNGNGRIIFLDLSLSITSLLKNR